MPKEEVTEVVLGSDVPKSTIYEMREMVSGPAWEGFCVVMANCINVSCAEIMGKDIPENAELQALAGMWKTLEKATAHFPAAVADAVEEIMRKEKEAAEDE